MRKKWSNDELNPRHWRAILNLHEVFPPSGVEAQAQQQPRATAMDVKAIDLGLQGGATCYSPVGVEQVDHHPVPGGDLRSTGGNAVED